MKKLLPFLIAVFLLQPQFTYSQTNPQYALNVVYFVPSDVKPQPKYKERISGILLQAQNFFKKDIAKFGYPNTTMGLRVNAENLVNIEVVKAKYSHQKYTEGSDEGNIPAIEEEVRAYFGTHPEKKLSEHFLIITPIPNNQDYGNDPNATGPKTPFVGTGRSCYAIDYKEMDVKYLGEEGRLSDLATTWIGGLIHELGHCLNLEHNCSKKSEQNNPKLGESLMAAGNSSYGVEPTHLTEVDAAVLNVNEIFTQNHREDQYGEAKAIVKKSTITNNSTQIKVQGEVESPVEITNFSVFLDPEGHNDYDRIGWTQKNANNTFQFDIPLSELKETNAKYNLIIYAIFENGSVDIFQTLDLTVTNGKAIFNNYTLKESLPKDEWSISEVSDFEEGNGAELVLDNDPKTYYHSLWTTGEVKHPHKISINMGKETSFNTIKIVNRESLSGIIKNFTLYISNDGENWKKVGNYTTKSGNFVVNEVSLEKTVVGQYIKMETRSCWNDENIVCIAELYFH